MNVLFFLTQNACAESDIMLPLELLGGGAKPSKAVWENNNKNLIANR